MTEVNQLDAALNQLDARLGHGVDPGFGSRLRDWLTVLIAAQ